ncbi:MFS transporter [Herbiconiux ginsengi]|uniref:Glycoside/pentoside/hexuronide:cation symporter, GPH family n=1 Tax=Herbiconiux ginsengi TaxID=381665 RepID=A0A1H3L965_9MICO|nr:glycoside-pentoside-hexuronide (GPH):cation symporter [Herbiconiux ginsengi]SDY60425.1 glycoside/pentoside/hexuronide:cation symporter, GPH family [Herbiconiux ginsengi]
MAKDSARTAAEQTRAAVALSTEDSATASFAAAAVGEAVTAPGNKPGTGSGQKLKVRERLAYGVGDIGGNLVFAPISAFLLFYFTDTVGIGAAIAGTLLLFGRVLDGTMDLVLGSFIDRTSTRWGKARPWILFSTPVVVISFVLLFNVPSGLNETGKEIYAFIMYFLCLGVGFVGSNLAYHTLLSVITSNSRMRVSLTVIRTFFALFTTLVVQFITIPIITSAGGGQQGWTLISIVYGAIAAITFLIVFFGTKERVKTSIRVADGDKLPFGKTVRILVKNPYFFLVFGFFLLNYLLTGTAGVGIYFASDVLGEANLYSFLGLISIAPLLVGMWFMPALIGRFGKRRLILIGVVIIIAGVLISLIDPSNFTLVLTGGLVRAMGGIPAAAALFALVADVVDYGEWKSGVRLDGMTYAAATAGQNFGAGLGVALVGWLLAAANYDGQAASQPASAVNMEVFLFLWLPLIVAVLMGVIIFFLNIDKNLSTIQRDLAARRAASETDATPAARVEG